MALSKRAEAWFSKQEKNDLELTEQQIRNFFKLSNAPAFDPLIEFQQRFGGLRIREELCEIN